MSDLPIPATPGCPNCIRLQRRVDELEERLADLEQRLGKNSSNSSVPPSANPPHARKPVVKKPTGKSPGGQPGHPGHHRKLLPVEQVDQVVPHIPGACQHCQSPLGSDAPRRLAGRHQVSELPPRAVIVTEHQAFTCTCPRCGEQTTAPIPPAIQSHCFGPRLSAVIGFSAALMHASRRATEELLSQVLGVPISLGSIIAREQELSRALVKPYQEARQFVQNAPFKNVDETGWKRAGRYLWLAATSKVAVFHVDRRRNRHAMETLLGEKVQGNVCTDRYGVYMYIDIEQRGLCWAHLKRDFQECVDLGGKVRPLGKRGLKIVKSVTRLFGKFKSGGIGRATLQQRLAGRKREMRRLLEEGSASGLRKAGHFCGQLLKLEPALWKFAEVPGMEPTNNHAERMLRPAVLWRKQSQGSHSLGGCRFVERMMTAVQTLKLTGRSVIGYLQEAVEALRGGQPPPSLLT